MSRNALSDLSPSVDVRWLIALAALVAVLVLVWSVPRSPTVVPLELVALGPGGGFRDTLDVPADWQDATAPPRVVRVPLVLGVRNMGQTPTRPDQLSLILPARYRLTSGEQRLEPVAQSGSPLVTYTLPTGLAPVEPGRLPTLLPALDTLWLELSLPAYHCIALADSVPELLPATRPDLSTLADVRIFFAFQGGDPPQRSAGTLTIRLDTAILDYPVAAPPPAYPVVMDPVLATPDLGRLTLVGRRAVPCGKAGHEVELTSTVWRGVGGRRMITLEEDGVVRKRFYDVNGDGIIDRESWDPDGDGTFEATRLARLRVPDLLLPLTPPGSRPVPASER